jgi:indolepyruvate ferredoxin oxidoreductase alpha subunit
MQERSHAFAMKSQIWLLDPRPNLPSMVKAVKMGFELSEASSTPVMLELRIRACHVHGFFTASDNKQASFTLKDAMDAPQRDVSRIVLPPASYLHEQEKIKDRWPAAVQFIQDQGLNEFFSESADDVGIIVQGGLYNTVVRALERLGLADIFGQTQIPLYVMNVTYPLVDAEIVRFCQGKKAVLMVEEGQPHFIEQNLSMILRKAGSSTVLHGKDVLPMAGEYTNSVVFNGLKMFFKQYEKSFKAFNESQDQLSEGLTSPAQAIAPLVHARPPGFCTGCPERPIFTAMKLMEREIGEHHISADIGCHLFSILPPFNLGNTTMGYGLGAAGASALNANASKRVISVMGDGGFWHNGLTSGIANSVFNKSDNLTVVVDNSYTSATGGQDVLSSKALNQNRSTGHEIEKAIKGVGVKWVRTVHKTYDIATMKKIMKEALTTKERGPKVVIAQSECMLNKQRREKPLVRAAIKKGDRVVREKFGVDSDTCTGDHSCIRISGCPSLSIKDNPDPLRQEPVATVLDSCVGCGVCGEASHAAVLCPSFYKAQIISNPSRIDRILNAFRTWVIDRLQKRWMKKQMAFQF